MSKNILITTSTFAQFDESPLRLLEEAGYGYKLNPYGHKVSEKELMEIVGDSIGIVAGTENLDAKVLEQIPQVKAIARCGIGLDNIDLEVAKQRSVMVTNTTGSIATSVAELTLGLILSLLRKTHVMDRQLHSGKWNKQMGHLLFGKKVGIVGFGRVGQAVANLLQSFSVQLKYHDINSIQGSTIEFLNLDDLLSWADIICLHVSTVKGQSYIIDKRELELMKDGAWIVNCARGGVVNEEALYDALKNDKLSGAAIDVFEQEPYVGSLKDLDECILTPHIGSYARETRIEMEIEAVNNLIESLRSDL